MKPYHWISKDGKKCVTTDLKVLAQRVNAGYMTEQELTIANMVTWDEFLIVASAFGRCMSGDFIGEDDEEDQKVFKLLAKLGLWDECDGYIGDSEA